MSFTQKLPFYFLCFLSFFPLMPYNFMSVGIIGFALSAIINGVKNNRLKTKHLIINVLFFVLTSATLLYSQDITQGVKNTIRDLSFLVFPVIFFFFKPKIGDKQLSILLNLFILSNILLLFYFIFYFYSIGYFIEPYFTKVRRILPFRKPLAVHFFKDWHSAYVGLWFGFSTFLLVKKSFYSKGFKRLIYLFFALFLFFAIFLLMARMALLLTSILILLYLNLKITNTKYRILFVFLTVSALLFVGVILKDNLTLSNRYSNIVNSFKASETFNESRFWITKSAFQAVQLSPIIGHGVGDVQHVLNNNYNKNGRLPKYFNTKLNSHNNYIHFLLVGGPILLMSFLILLYYCFKIAILKRNINYFVFLFFISVSLLTENMFMRMHGILFFSLFNALFYFNIIKQKED